MVKNSIAGKVMLPGRTERRGTQISRRTVLILLAMLAIGAVALFTGIADAAMQSIRLDSSASFPVDI